MKDPYLIPSQICEVWNGDAIIPVKELYYFSGYGIQDELLFGKEKNRIAQHLKVFEHYRPIGTEWDFDPPWAVCSTVCANGSMIFWKNIAQAKHMHCYYLPNDNYDYFVCPDKSRYEGDAWKTSLRMRPEWAMKKDNG